MLVARREVRGAGARRWGGEGILLWRGRRRGTWKLSLGAGVGLAEYCLGRLMQILES